MILPSLSDGPTPDLGAQSIQTTPTDLEIGGIPAAVFDDLPPDAPAPADDELRDLAREISRLSPNLASVLVSAGMRHLLAGH